MQHTASFILFFSPAACYYFLPEFVSELSTIQLRITISSSQNYISRYCILPGVAPCQGIAHISECAALLLPVLLGWNKCLHALKTLFKGLGAAEETGYLP